MYQIITCISMYAIVAIFVNIVIQVYCDNANNKLVNTHNGNTTVQLSNEELLAFMELHLQYCPGYDFCWLHTSNASTYMETSYSSMSFDCAPCKCDDSCIDLGNCCPDFKLRQFMSKVYTNVTEYTSDVPRLNQNTSINIYQPQRDLHGDCVPDTLQLTSQIVFPSETRMTSYNMITSCPDGTDVDLSDKCSRKVNETDDDFMWLPVISRKTGTVYLNKYCMSCYETDEPFYPFSLRVKCRKSQVYIPPAATPSKILTWLKTTQQWNCYLFVSPPDGFMLDTCTAVDTRICTQRSGFHDDKVSWDTLCSAISLPVSYKRNKDGIVLNVFQNAACVFCNLGHMSKSDIDGLFNIVPTYSILELNPFGEDMLRLPVFSPRMWNRKTTKCSRWTIDNNNGTCIRVFCPRLMYQYKNKCVPLFTWMNNVYMRAILRITMQQLLVNQSQLKRFSKDLTATIADVANHASIGNYSYGIWYDDRNTLNNKTLFVLVLYFKLKEDSTYPQYVQKLSTFTDNLETMYVDLGELPLNVKLSDKYSFRFGSISDVPSSYRLSEVKSLTREAFFQQAYIQMSTSMICPRVLLDHNNDLVFLSKSKMWIKETGLLVSSPEIEDVETGILVCADRYITRLNKGIKRKQTPDKRQGQQDIKIEIKLLLPIGVTVILVLIVIFRVGYQIWKCQ